MEDIKTRNHFRWRIKPVVVVYVDQLSDAACTRKLVQIIFWLLLEFFLLFNHFSSCKKCVLSDYFRLINTQTLIDSLRGYPVFCFLVHLWLKRRKKFKKPPKIISTNFYLLAAPKSWSKYTTISVVLCKYLVIDINTSSCIS